MHDGEDIAGCALKFGARAKRLKLALSVGHEHAITNIRDKMFVNGFWKGEMIGT
jgi:hypothetical protein